MKTKALIAADKESVRTGEWRRGKIPRSHWPSRRAKSKAYKYGPRYQWRIITFTANGYDCRVRLLLNMDAQIFRASFGVTEDGETKTICEYEFHASEPGWHCHAKCEHVEEIDPSKVRFGSERLPAYRSHHRRGEFKFGKSDIDEVTAFNCAVTVFRIRNGGGLF